MGKVHVLFYSEPSKKNLNSVARDAIKAENFPAENFQSWAVVNMASSAIPNFMISHAIKDSQEENPRTIYVKDSDRSLVAWGLADKNNDLTVFDKSGKVVVSFTGLLSY